MTIKKLDEDNRTPDEQAADDKIRRWVEKWQDSRRWIIRELQQRGVKRAMSHADDKPPQGWDPEALTEERRGELRAWIEKTVLAVCDDPPGAPMTRSWFQRFLHARPDCPDEVFWSPDYFLAQELLNPVLARLTDSHRIEEYRAAPELKINQGVLAFRKVNLLVAIAKASQGPEGVVGS